MSLSLSELKKKEEKYDAFVAMDARENGSAL